uniref:ribosomal protein S15 n=1 Tax=Nonea vesicaria TaxID=256494 RepID=UPI001EDF7863|nr:ribosomal protein S15 [Nonea vesicaria]UJV31790.1 ribosomal protein S15 [Nonea vesicaria]
MVNAYPFFPIFFQEENLVTKEENSVSSQEENKGSVEFQVLSFTNKIRKLTSHLELHKKDYLAQRGLQKILGKRQRLLADLSKKDRVRYKELINRLGIRERKTS